jgi:hypothetical protein
MALIRDRRVGLGSAAAGGGGGFLTPSQLSTPGGGGTPFDSYPEIISGSSAGDVLWNAATGTLTQAQQANLVNEEQAELVQAGMDPDDATAQSLSDVQSTLDTYTGPGAFGTFTGATSDSAVSGLLQSFGLSGVPSLFWWVAGGVAAIWALKEFRIIK